MKWLTRSAMLMAVLSVGGCLTTPVSNVTAPAWVSTSSVSAQQIWGVYDGLAGTTWSAPNSYVLFYRWAVPGQVLVEEFRHPSTGELAGTNIIVPGSTPGRLVLTSSVGNMQWQGTIDGDGNVLFVRDGMLQMPMRMSLTATGNLLQEKVTLDGAEVAIVDSSTAYTSLGKESVANTAEATPAATHEATSLAASPTSSSTDDYSAKQIKQLDKDWGVFDEVIGKTWLSEGTGGRGAHPFILKIEKSEDGRSFIAYTGNAHRLEKSIEYQLASSGSISATGNTLIGPKSNMPVTIQANGDLVRYNSESDRSSYQLDEAGYLLVKHETKGWLSDAWTIDSTVRLRDVTMGPEWGPFSKLAGAAWVNKKNIYPEVYYEFSYPDKNVMHVWIGPDNDKYWGTDGVVLTSDKLIGHTESSIKNTYLLEPGDSFYSVDSTTSMVRHIGQSRRDVYSLVDENTVTISQQEIKNGQWQSIKEVVLSRELESEKNERLQLWAANEQKRRDSERSTQFLNSMAALNGALTAANEAASQQAAESQASLDRTLAIASRQAELERVTARSSESSSPTDTSTEADQDATVAAALTQVRQMAEETGGDSQLFAQVDEAQQLLADKKARRQQAGTNKILPSKIQLSTATNSIIPSSNLPEPVADTNNMTQGKVRLCNRPGDEGPAHWPTCPQTRAEEKETRRLAAAGGNGNSSGNEYGKTSGGSRSGQEFDTGSGDSGQSGKSGGANNGSQNPPGKAATSDDEAVAWCTQTKIGKFMCWGPNAKTSTYDTLKIALSMAGCSKGEGDSPTVGESTFFHCNVKLPPWPTDVPESYPDW